MLSHFKALVDQSKFPDVFNNGDLEKQYKVLGLPTSNGLSIHKLIDAISNHIRDALQPVDGQGELPYSFFLKLTKTITYDIVLRGTNRIYLAVAEAILHSLRGKQQYVGMDQWQPAVNWASAMITIQKKNTPVPNTDLRFFHPRDVDTALAIQRLTAQGCGIQWEDGEIIVVSGMDSLIDRLESLIGDIGGPNVMSTIFSGSLNKSYYYRVRRYLFSAVIPASPAQMAPKVPIGYLLNLAAKYPIEKVHSKDQMPAINSKWRELVSLTTDFLKIKDVQSYSIWAQALRRPEDMIQGLHDTILYDAAVRIPQSNPSIEMEMLPVLFKWIDAPEFYQKAEFQPDHYFSVAQAIVDITLTKRGPQIVYASAIQKHLSSQQIPGNVVLKILQVMSHQPAEVNTTYRQITDSHLANTHKKPLVQLGPTKFVMYDSSWSAMGFFETLVHYAKLTFDAGKDRKHQHTDRNIGFGLEHYIRQKLDQHNVTHYTGKFTDIDRKDAECDVLIEGTDYLVIIEIKKKQLTAQSRAGNMASAFLDLYSTLLQSQIQAGKTEIMLRSCGYIDLSDKKNIHKTNWNSRSILRISVTHYDFESLHDRQIAKQILQTFAEGTFTLSPDVSPEVAQGYKYLQEDAEKWKQQFLALKALDPEFSNNPFFSTWFLSTCQLLLLLDGTNTSDEFIQNLLKTKNISLSSNNFYVEYLKGPDFDQSGAGVVLYTPPKIN